MTIKSFNNPKPEKKINTDQIKKKKTARNIMKPLSDDARLGSTAKIGQLVCWSPHMKIPTHQFSLQHLHEFGPPAH